LTGKEWDPKNWNGDIWGDPDGSGDTGLLNYDESSLTVETVSPPPVKVTSQNTQVAQSVKHLTSAQVKVTGSEDGALGGAQHSVGSLLLPLRLPLPPVTKELRVITH